MEPRYNGGANGLANFLYIEDVFRIFYYYGGGEYRSYIEVRYVEILMYFFFSPCRWRFQRRKEFVQMCENTKGARGSGFLGLVSHNL